MEEKEKITGEYFPNKKDEKEVKARDDGDEVDEIIDAITSDRDELEEADVSLTDKLLKSNRDDLNEVIESAYAIDIAIALEDFSDDDIIIISMNGIIIRMKANEINQQSRYAGGVKVMRLDENDRAVTFAVTMSDDEVENARPTSEELPDDEKEAEGNSVKEEDLIRDYDAEEEELVQQSADEDIE